MPHASMMTANRSHRLVSVFGRGTDDSSRRSAAFQACYVPLALVLGRKWPGLVSNRSLLRAPSHSLCPVCPDNNKRPRCGHRHEPGTTLAPSGSSHPGRSVRLVRSRLIAALKVDRAPLDRREAEGRQLLRAVWYQKRDILYAEAGRRKYTHENLKDKRPRSTALSRARAPPFSIYVWTKQDPMGHARSRGGGHRNATCVVPYVCRDTKRRHARHE